VNHIKCFSSAMAEEQLFCPDALIDDGEIHRFHVAGDSSNSRNGWYSLHGTAPHWGVFGSWRTNVMRYWQAKSLEIMTKLERYVHKERLRMSRLQQQRDRQQAWLLAEERANSIWKNAKLSPSDHPYLVKKCINSYHLKSHKGSLLVPLYDSNRLVSLQFIDSGSGKRFMKGGRTKGCYSPLGEVSDTVYICEGWATACTIFEKTGMHTLAAMTAGNLKALALAIKFKYRASKIVIAADNDRFTFGNPGLTKAKEAARAVGGDVICPKFPDGAPGTDWNDLENWSKSSWRT
jgi:putative DNA primase/helicase